jgi:hypothetical protein
MSSNTNPFKTAWLLEKLMAPNTSQYSNSNLNSATAKAGMTANQMTANQIQQALYGQGLAQAQWNISSPSTSSASTYTSSVPYGLTSCPDAEIILSCLALICSVGEDLARRWFTTIFEQETPINHSKEWDTALEMYKERNNHKEDDLDKIIGECAKELSL